MGHGAFSSITWPFQSSQHVRLILKGYDSISGTCFVVNVREQVERCQECSLKRPCLKRSDCMASSDGPSFWDDTETFDGEPSSWPKDDLVQWLQRATGEPADSFSHLSKAALLKQIVPELDKLYASFAPSFEYKSQQFSLDSLLCWTPSLEKSPSGIAKLHELKRLAGLRVAGTMEREFYSMYTFTDKMHNLATALPMGRHPADDLRQDLLIISQAFDRDGNKAAALIQTYTQEEALSMVIKEPVVLPPNRKLRQGDEVVVVRGPPEQQQQNQQSKQQQQQHRDASRQQQDQQQKSSSYAGLHGTVVQQRGSKEHAGAVLVQFSKEVRLLEG